MPFAISKIYSFLHPTNLKGFILRNRLGIAGFVLAALLFSFGLSSLSSSMKARRSGAAKIRQISRVKAGQGSITVVHLPQEEIIQRRVPEHFEKFLKDAGLCADEAEDRSAKDSKSAKEKIKDGGEKLDDKTVPEGKRDLENLNIITIVNDPIDDSIMDQLRALVGSLHRLRLTRHKVPRIFVFTTQRTKADYLEEISMWTSVEVHNIQMYLGLPLVDTFKLKEYINAEVVRRILINRVAQMWGHAVWVRLGYAFEPNLEDLVKTEKSENPQEILESLERARKFILPIIDILYRDGYIVVKPKDDSKFLAIEGYQRDHVDGFKLLQEQLDCFYGRSSCDVHPLSRMQIKLGNEFGLVAYDPKSEAMCHVDIKEDSVMNQIISDQLDLTDLPKAVLDRYKDPKIKKIGIAMPTTSRNLKPGQELVFLKTFLPSFFKTVSPEEFKRFNYIIYLGFDHGDQFLDDPKERAKVKKMIKEMTTDQPVIVKFIRFPNTKRVAMLWSMLFVRAMKEGCDYFYQVNDDLTLVTRGWASNFTGVLDQNGGFGVVGPADNHNGFNCTLLTQAMVSRTHYDIFTMFYPTDLKDWKTDRWLSHVYGPENTFCYHNIIANNGGAPTRYRHCIFLSWKIYLEAGKRRIADWLVTHKVEKKQQKK